MGELKREIKEIGREIEIKDVVSGDDLIHFITEQRMFEVAVKISPVEIYFVQLKIELITPSWIKNKLKGD